MHNFTIPNLSPFEAMDWLVERSITFENLPNFFFFENRSGYNFVSLTSLMSRNSVGTINFDIKNVDDLNQEFFGARSVQVLTQSHLGKAIRNGIFAGTMIEFDNYSGYYNEKTFGINDLTKKLNNKNNHGTAVTNRNGTDLTTAFASRTITSISPVGRQTGVVADYLKQNDPDTANIVDDTNNWKYPRKSIVSNLVQKRLKMTVPGDFIFSSGFNVDLKGFNLTMVSKANSKDVSTNGRYMIIAARHMIKPQKFETYEDEIQYLISHEQRNKFITNLTLDLKGNTLVLFSRVESHGAVLYERINNSKQSNRKVFFVHGGVDAEEREMVREITERENDAIIVASYGTFSTGINIKNLHNVIFASPSKSRIRNLQSIGRVLRKGKNKTKAVLYDIADDCTYNSRKNYTLNHLIERIKTYNEENFNYEIITIQLKSK